jgi:hypothetical protein
MTGLSAFAPKPNGAFDSEELGVEKFVVGVGLRAYGFARAVAGRFCTNASVDLRERLRLVGLPLVGVERALDETDFFGPGLERGEAEDIDLDGELKIVRESGRFCASFGIEGPKLAFLSQAIGGCLDTGGAGVMTAAENNLRAVRRGLAGDDVLVVASSAEFTRLGSSFPFTSELAVIAPDDHRFATEVTLPPRPPRAERISYLTSRSTGLGGGNDTSGRPLGGEATVYLGGCVGCERLCTMLFCGEATGTLGGGGGGGGDLPRYLGGSGVLGLLFAAAEYDSGMWGLVNFGSIDAMVGVVLADGGETLRSVLIDSGGTIGVIAKGVLRPGSSLTAGGEDDDQISCIRLASSETDVSRSSRGGGWIVFRLSVAIGTNPEERGLGGAVSFKCPCSCSGVAQGFLLLGGFRGAEDSSRSNGD